MSRPDTDLGSCQGLEAHPAITRLASPEHAWPKDLDPGHVDLPLSVCSYIAFHARASSAFAVIAYNLLHSERQEFTESIWLQLMNSLRA